MGKGGGPTRPKVRESEGFNLGQGSTRPMVRESEDLPTRPRVHDKMVTKQNTYDLWTLGLVDP